MLWRPTARTTPLSWVTNVAGMVDGCAAHHNADDGLDLYAKLETGPIGGKGNGFKLGGSNILGGHELINSCVFFNRAKGIDSNSCPDIVLKTAPATTNCATT